MAQFLGDLVVLFELALLAAGLVVLHEGRRQSASLLQVAAVVLILGGAAGAACSVYYYLQYRAAGDFESAYPSAQRGAIDMFRMMMGAGPGMMGGSPGMMAGAGTGCPQLAPPPTPGAGPEQHELHHPDAGKPQRSGP